jgi:hypothetical protein
MTTAPEPQAARAVMMIRPASFAANPQTAASNAFQARVGISSGSEVQTQARTEFEGLAQALTHAGVDVRVFDDTHEPCKPDAVFTDNWVSFHADGSVVLYPMLARNRRLERRPELVERLAALGSFRITRVVDLSAHEVSEEYLEGCGSLVLDRTHRLAYACLSPRTHLSALGDFAQQLDYEVVSFDATDSGGVAIYHTNVMMCLGADFTVVCSESIRDEQSRTAVHRHLSDTGHELIDISLAQVGSFAGNMLPLESTSGTPLIAMSSAAWSCLGTRQRARLERHGQIVTSPIPTIEHFGGGSVRCMLADIHLPTR